MVDTQLTVNCLFDNYSSFRLYLTRSSSILAPMNIVSVADARVYLYEEDTFREVLVYVPSDTANTFGAYQSSFTPVFGKKYSIRVEHPHYGIVTANERMPVLIRMDSVRLVSKGDASQNQDGIVEIFFSDIAAEKNMYRLNTWLQMQRAVVNETTGDTVISTTSDGRKATPEEELSDFFQESSWSILFSDGTFNGRQMKLTLHFKAVRLSRYEEVNLYVDLLHISQAYYDYIKTLKQQRSSNEDDDFLPVYGNVKNGYGIFAGSAIHSAMIKLK